MTTIGLRIDVDTHRGTQRGVPTLLRILDSHNVTGTFFFSLGPDNMGRHLWRLAKPAFLWKMLRTRATSLYGWDILLRGTFWPGRRIGESNADVIRQTAARGHEVGLHAWDHHAWQAHVDEWDTGTLSEQIRLGVDALTEILGSPPLCSAAPGWRCTERALLAKATFPFTYNSDCRGESMFRPQVAGALVQQVQIPVTLPTYDELYGRDGVDDDNYNETILASVRPGQLNVLTIHAEVEGISRAGLFDEFLLAAAARGVSVVPLATLLAGQSEFAQGSIVDGTIAGRQGSLARQSEPCA